MSHDDERIRRLETGVVGQAVEVADLELQIAEFRLQTRREDEELLRELEALRGRAEISSQKESAESDELELAPLRDALERLRRIGTDPGDLGVDSTLAALGCEWKDSFYDTLSVQDYVAAIVAGSLGALVQNLGADAQGNLTLDPGGSHARSLTRDFHDSAAAAGPAAPDDGFLRRLFAHGGDNIDRIPDGMRMQRVPFDMHRLYSGHDLFQFSSDNTFLTMFQQYGAMGFLKSFVHLGYDFFSTRGLPLPGSSNFAALIYEQWSGRSPRIYEHFFTMKARDLIGAGATYGLLQSYRFVDRTWGTRRSHSPKDPLFNKLNLLAHGVCFGVSLTLGALNPISATAIVKNAVQLQWKNLRRTREVVRRVDALSEKMISERIDHRSLTDRVSDMNAEFEMLCTSEPDER